MSITQLFENYKQYEFMKKFLSKSILDMRSYHMDYIKFVFKEEDLKSISSKLDMTNERYEYCFKKLYKNIKEYNNIDENNDSIFIKIDDSHRFFSLLYEIEKAMGAESYAYNLTASIWLRMGVNDIEDVNSFLERELAFIKDKTFHNECCLIGNDKDVEFYYEDNYNENFFETNKHISFYLQKNDKTYELPVIHYAIKDRVCYIYGIQNLEKVSKDEEIKEYLNPLKKRFRNKYLNYEFVLSLKLFLELLKLKRIRDIKVPLLEVFNYPYHESISKLKEKEYNKYTEEQIREFEERTAADLDEDLFEYLYVKSSYLRFHDKQDIISRNKTERLVENFMLMQEFFGNVEFLNDPFIEDEYLNIKLDDKKSKMKTL